jgi:hypothetical protein
MSQGKFRDLTGQRFGEWTVIRLATPRLTPSGLQRTMWLCRCSCGNRRSVGAQALYEGESRRCVDCALQENARRQREVRSRRVAGTTIALIAQRAGLPFDTVYHRWCRGWPLERLGAPIVKCYAKRPESRRRMEAA